jgi:8-hydroxy-5-deazaflavin:NADPH oxidoreductase
MWPQALPSVADGLPARLPLGIVGAGKFGTTIARAAIAAGYDVAISGSGSADDIALTVDVLAPGAHAATTDAVVRHADIIVLAVPAHRFRELAPDLFAGKILVDAMNYWEAVDGVDQELTDAPAGTSSVVRDRFPTARVVKSLNQLGYHELEDTRRPKGAPDRIAIGAAGDDRLAVRAVMRLVDRLGFDPVDAGALETAWRCSPTARRTRRPTTPPSSPISSRSPRYGPGVRLARATLLLLALTGTSLLLTSCGGSSRRQHLRASGLQHGDCVGAGVAGGADGRLSMSPGRRSVSRPPRTGGGRSWTSSGAVSRSSRMAGWPRVSYERSMCQRMRSATRSRGTVATCWSRMASTARPS